MGVNMALAAMGYESHTAWVSDIEPGPCNILAHHHPDIPNLGDITQVDWTQVEPVDVITGGSPCQDLSLSGRRAGMRPGTRSGLWESMAHAINQLQPRLVVWENVTGALSARSISESERKLNDGAFSLMESDPGRVGGDTNQPVLRALGRVLGDLTNLGYGARWATVRASDIGAPHRRERVFVVAYPHRAGLEGYGHRRQLEPEHPRLGGSDRLLPTPTAATRDRTDAELDWGDYAPAIERWERILGRPAPEPTTPSKAGKPQLSAPFVEWMMGLPEGHVTSPEIGISRARQLKALGNGVVPQQAEYAIRLLLGKEG